MVWHPGLAFLRIRQAYRVTTKASLVSGHGADKVSDAVLAYAQECGITWATHWRIAYRSRPLILCPQCRSLAWRLIENPDGAWVCRRCWPRAMGRTDRLLAEFLFGMRIGLRHVEMAKRRRRLLLRLRDAVPRAKNPVDLVRLAEGAELLAAYRVRHSRRGSRDLLGTPPLAVRLAGGPVWRAAAHHVIPSLIDTILHPTAYQAQYGAFRRAA